MWLRYYINAIQRVFNSNESELHGAAHGRLKRFYYCEFAICSEAAS